MVTSRKSAAAKQRLCNLGVMRAVLSTCWKMTLNTTPVLYLLQSSLLHLLTFAEHWRFWPHFPFLHGTSRGSLLDVPQHHLHQMGRKSTAFTHTTPAHPRTAPTAPSKPNQARLLWLQHCRQASNTALVC